MSRCRVTAADEPLAGTAPEAIAWLAVEEPGPWGAKADLALDLPGDVRVILIRRQRSKSATRNIFLAVPQSGLLAHWRVSDITEVQNLNIAGIIEGREQAPPTGRHLTLVCTNGKRDQCCAIDGRALFDHLHHLPDVWECSHVGGHRFAPVVLHLPDSHVYGRVCPTDAELIAAGQVPPHALRGPSNLPTKSQAAVVAVRQLIGACGPEDVIVVGEEPNGAITVASQAHSWRVVLRTESTPGLRPESCGGQPGPVTGWLVDELTAIQ